MPEQNLIAEVTRLRSQAMSDDQIAQTLLYKGYTNAQVFDALSQASVTAVFDEAEKQTMEYTQDQSQYQYQQPAPMPQMPQMEHPMMQQQTIDANKISEIAESIIEEKWSDLVDHVNRIIEWKSSMEVKLNTMDEQIKMMKGEFETLHKAILGKINDSDSVMKEVSTDIKALEQVFKKILPGFVENVNELSRITQNIKKK